MSRGSTVACTVCEVHAESTFRIDGMDCHEEVAILERRLKNLSGLESLSADVMGQRLLVKYDAARLTTNTITDAVADTGMRAWLEHEQPRATATTPLRTRLLVLSGVTLVAGLLLSAGSAPFPLVLVLYLTSVVSAGVYPVRKAWAAARARHLDINVLMTVAVIGACVLGQWSEAGTVVFLFALAQYLEARSMDRARHAIRALMDLTPQEALVVRSSGDVRVGVDDVAIGEIVRVRPGDKVPLDGVVVDGVSDVNQAPITGESMPAEKQPGSELFAGSINGHGALLMRVTRFRGDTTLARIIHLVEEAQSQRAPSQAFVERFARLYTPAVLLLAALVAVVPPLAAGYPVSDWIYRALVLLVIACPCALVISTPVSIVSALAAAARRGVLIKGGLHLERARYSSMHRVRQDRHTHQGPPRRGRGPRRGRTFARRCPGGRRGCGGSIGASGRSSDCCVRGGSRDRKADGHAISGASWARRRGNGGRPAGAQREPSPLRGASAPDGTSERGDCRIRTPGPDVGARCSSQPATRHHRPRGRAAAARP